MTYLQHLINKITRQTIARLLKAAMAECGMWANNLKRSLTVFFRGCDRNFRILRSAFRRYE